MAEVEDRATRLEGGGERPDVDEDLRETQKQADRNDRSHGADLFPDREPPDRADKCHDDDLGGHAVDDLADGFTHERTPRRHPVRILGS